MPFGEPTVSYRVETVVEGVVVPWSIAWTASDRMLFNERPGRVRQVVNGKLDVEPLYVVPNIRAGGGEIGLMGLCVHPDYATNKFVYLSFGYQLKTEEGTQRDIRVQRFRDDGKTLVPDKILVTIEPAGSNHAGCRIAFGPDGMLYVTTGEAFQRRFAKDMTSLAGKILRLRDDGSVPEDNPFVGPEFKEKGYRPEIWSYGHRNPQGIDWQPGTGFLFETEHGPSGSDGGTGGDEFNMVEKGKNYGWPDIHHAERHEGMESPLIVWDPAMAPASGVFYNGDKLPELKGNFLVGMLGGLGMVKRPGIARIVLDGQRVARQELLVTDLGRIRCVAVGPDGYVYFSTSNKDGRGRPAANDDRILRLVPESK